MLKRYETIVKHYARWYPSFYESTVECIPSGRYCILATLKDGSVVEFNSLDNTIRDVTKFYDRDTSVSFDEETWRKEFGHKLRKAITSKGVNQDKLADALGISRQMLTRYVRGTSTPSGYNLSRLAEVLECDVRELTKLGYIDD